MCNTCNSCSSLWNSFGCSNTFNRSLQSICRDCNGNIWVRAANGNSSCGCNAYHCCYPCACNTCGYNTSNANLATNNGYGCNRSCVTLCGNSFGLSQNRSGCGSSNFCVDGNAYYARQYGATNSGRSSYWCGYND